MDSILAYLLSSIKKAKFIVFSQRGLVVGRQNKVGTIASFSCPLPQEYDQGRFPTELQVENRKYTLESADRNVLVFSSDSGNGKAVRLGLLFAAEHEAFVAVGFVETALHVDYYDQLQFVRSELEQRGGFSLQQPRAALNYDRNNLTAQEALVFGLPLPFIQRASFCQKQQMLCVAFADPLGPDFEFLIQKLAAIQRRCPFCYFAVILRNLVVVQDKKVDGIGLAQAKLRELTQRARFSGELNVIADYPGLLDEALEEVPFCYQFFFPSGQRFHEELGCLAEDMEKEIRAMISAYERVLRRQFEQDKIRHLRKLNYEALPTEDKQRLVFEVNKTNRQRVQARRDYYQIRAKTELDTDMLVQGGKLLFSGMELNLIRFQPRPQVDKVVLAVTDEEFLPDYLAQLKEFAKDFFVIFLIKDCWQFNIRKIQDQYKELAQYNILADEFGIFDRIAAVCGRNNCLVKAEAGKIIKVVATVKDLQESEDEISAKQAERTRAELENYEQEKQEKFRAMFREVDADSVGMIEFRAIKEAVGPWCEELLILADKDGSGALDEQEFINFMCIVGL